MLVICMTSPYNVSVRSVALDVDMDDNTPGFFSGQRRLYLTFRREERGGFLSGLDDSLSFLQIQLQTQY